MRQRMMGAMAIAGLVLGGAGVLRGEEMPVMEGADGEEAREIEYTVCAQGVLKECGSITSKRCTQYVVSSGSGTVSYGTGSGSVSGSAEGTCISWTETTTKLYKDRYKPKAG